MIQLNFVHADRKQGNGEKGQDGAVRPLSVPCPRAACAMAESSTKNEQKVVSREDVCVVHQAGSSAGFCVLLLWDSTVLPWLFRKCRMP